MKKSIGFPSRLGLGGPFHLILTRNQKGNGIIDVVVDMAQPVPEPAVAWKVGSARLTLRRDFRFNRAGAGDVGAGA